MTTRIILNVVKPVLKCAELVYAKSIGNVCRLCFEVIYSLEILEYLVSGILSGCKIYFCLMELSNLKSTMCSIRICNLFQNSDYL
jgi:hypothetical protein